jgi:hypothetical protein
VPIKFVCRQDGYPVFRKGHKDERVSLHIHRSMILGSESGDPDSDIHACTIMWQLQILDIKRPKAGVSAAFMQS